MEDQKVALELRRYMALSEEKRSEADKKTSLITRLEN
jgi:hypothetical protein